MMKIRFSLFLAILFLAFAANAQITSNPQLSSGQPAEQPKPKWVQPVYRLNYTLNTDLADPLEPRRFDHNFDFSPLLLFRDNWVLTGDFEASYYSLDNSIPVDHNLQFSDWALSAGKLLTFGSHSQHMLLLTVGNNFPTSENSQYEGMQAIPNATAIAIFKFPKLRSMILNTFNYSYYVNQNEFSPLTGQIEPQQAELDQVAWTYFILENWSVSATFGIKNTTNKDGFNEVNFMNGVGTDVYFWDYYFAELDYQNGNFLDNTSENVNSKIDLWYIDQYRQLVTFMIGANF